MTEFCWAKKAELGFFLFFICLFLPGRPHVCYRSLRELLAPGTMDVIWEWDEEWKLLEAKALSSLPNVNGQSAMQKNLSRLKTGNLLQ